MSHPDDSSRPITGRIAAPAGSSQEVRVLDDPAHVATLLEPERRRVMEALREAPDSASGLARRLQRSRQRLNYHLRVLEEASLVELHEERPARGFVERIMRPSAGRFLVDPGAADAAATEGLPDPASAGDRLSATQLIALAARTIQEVATLRDRADTEEKRLATAGFEAQVRLGSPAEFQEFVSELSRAIAGVAARFDRDEPEARAFRVVGGSYPAPSTDPATAGKGGPR